MLSLRRLLDSLFVSVMVTSSISPALSLSQRCVRCTAPWERLLSSSALGNGTPSGFLKGRSISSRCWRRPLHSSPDAQIAASQARHRSKHLKPKYKKYNNIYYYERSLVILCNEILYSNYPCFFFFKTFIFFFMLCLLLLTFLKRHSNLF